MGIFEVGCKGNPRNTLWDATADVLLKLMRQALDRTVFTVLRNGGVWAVEHDGGYFGHSSDKEIAKAYAFKRAREIVDGGGGAQVRVQGEGVGR